MDLKLIATSIAMIAGITLCAHASAELDYQNTLRIAEKKVLRQKAARAQGYAISTSLSGNLFGRAYQVGDQWDVAALHYDVSLVAKNERSSPTKMRNKIVGIFRYEVIESNKNRVRLKVTQLQDLGFKVIDSKVNSLTLTMSDDASQTGKYYSLTHSDQPVAVSAQGTRSNLTLLELFPLDIPEISASVQNNATEMPELPSELQAVSDKTGLKPDIKKSSWFEQDDFFGRPVQFLWQQGNPWPSYLKTPHGIAILIRKTARSS